MALNNRIDGATRTRSPLSIFLALGIVAMVLSACATSNEVKWAQGKTALTDITNVLANYRAPCVKASGILNAGPDHPGCKINDDAYMKITKLRTAAEMTLQQLDGVAAGTETISADRLLAELENILLQLLIEKEAAAAR